MIKIYLKENNEFLYEDIEAVKKYYPNIDDDTFIQLIQLDPTYRGNDSVGKYGKWLLNLYNKGNLSEGDFEEVTPLLNQFTTYRNRIQNKDLNSYKTLDDLSDVLASVINDDSMLTDRQKVRFLKNVKSGKIKTGKENDYDVDFNDSDWIVYIPHTHEASMKLGKGTEWCTAHENPEWYNSYTYEDGEEFSLYIMKNKNTGERFQYCDNPYKGYDYQFMDETDTDVDMLNFMSDCDDETFKQYLNNLNPDFFKNIKEADGLIIEDGVLTGVSDYFEPDIIVPDEVSIIGEEAFFESDIHSITITSNVKQIELLAFSGSSLAKIDLDEAYSLSYIGFGAFKFCEYLNRTISLPNIKVILDDAFAYSGITNVYIGDGIVSLGKRAFCGCENLEEVEIEDCAKPLDIPEQAFANCRNLKTIYLPKNINSINKYAFSNSDDITIYSDSQWLRDNIENFYVDLYDMSEEPIYLKGKGYVN